MDLSPDRLVSRSCANLMTIGGMVLMGCSEPAMSSPAARSVTGVSTAASAERDAGAATPPVSSADPGNSADGGTPNQRTVSGCGGSVRVPEWLGSVPYSAALCVHGPANINFGTNLMVHDA